ncbi:hypothetical protein L3Q65_38110 [Amycolatopsis sp. FU40]|uniref:hypothetical protein n=1 Tax=Amycolatopsis sp. FU40 TaxID=2914159 RepID=UPI001F2DDDE9|nr:hypothetical protein [Amycolatopsis sp. FU40]UKD53661.1 hypothetical protein L3Q65_38110 [Amycolatopsis sp. FU40]
MFIRPQQSLLGRVAGWLIRMRAELTILAFGILCYVWLTHVFSPLGVDITLGVALIAIFAVPGSRRYVTRRSWCVLTRHRVRACFTQTRTMTHDGKMPSLLWAKPTPVGERVRVWLPAGLSVKDLENVSENLAAACFARYCRIEPDRKRATACFILIIRRDPLGTGKPVTPDLLDQVDDYDQDDTNVVPLPTRESVMTEVTAAQTAQPVDTARAPRKGTRPAGQTGKSATVAEPAPEVQGFGGMDVSDYV